MGPTRRPAFWLSQSRTRGLPRKQTWRAVHWVVFVGADELVPRDANQPRGRKDLTMKDSAKKKFLPLHLLALVLLIFVGYWWLQLYHYRHRSSTYEACRNNLKNIGMALEMYSTDSSGRYPSTLDLLVPEYLKVIPTCSSAGRPSYSYSAFSSPDRYTVYCAGSNHTTRAGPDEPCYSSDAGLLPPLPMKEKILQWLDAFIP